MKTRTTLVTTLFAMASLTLVAQQSPSTSQPDQQTDSPPTRQNPASTAPATPDSQDTNTASAAPSAPLSPVNGELVSKLDSKTAKNGDSVVIQTKTPAKTADGADIPKGSKLVGHVLGVKASEGGQNSQVVLQFDHLELKGGQSVPVHSQIQSITPAGGAASAGRSSAMSAPPPSSGTSSPGANAAGGDSSAGAAPQSPGSNAAASAGDSPAAGSPAPGTVVAKTGAIAISTTSVPGVLLANNAPGQQDPRMAQASSILLGAKQDIQLDSGTQVVVGISSAAGGGTQ